MRVDERKSKLIFLPYPLVKRSGVRCSPDPVAKEHRSVDPGKSRPRRCRVGRPETPSA